MSSPNSIGYSPSALASSRLAAADASAASRKRQTPSAPVYSPNETLNQMTQEAEARQQDKYNVQKEIRAIRAQEMEKQRKEDEERDREDSNNRSTHTSKPSLTPILPKHRILSTNRSIDEHSPSPSSNTPDPDNPRELKKKLAELEEKYTKHAIYQTQFENDNQKLLFEVDILKDLIEEHEELIIELRRQFKEKSRELDYQKRTNKDLQTDFARLKEILKQRDKLIEDSGLILYTDNELNEDGTHKSNGDSDSPGNEIKSVLPAALVAPETAKLLDMMGEGTIDDKLRKLLENKSDLKEQNNRLKSELEDERIRISSLEKKLANHASKIQDNQENAQDLHEIQRQYTKEINEFKMKNQKLDHENIVIKQDLQRLQTQLKYMQTNFDEIEQSEQKLNKEKRDAQREMRELKTKYQDSLLDNKRLQDRIDSLEFYSKTNTNSTAFHNLNANSNTNGPSSSSSRSRTPAPISRQRIGSTASALNYGMTSGINYGSNTPLNSAPSLYESYRSGSRQGSVDRSITDSSYASNPGTVRSSRQSSPTRTLEPSERSYSSTLPPRPSYSNQLPPHPSYDSGYSRFREKSAVPSSSVTLRNRRDSSQERLMRPPSTSSLIKLRRSSFVDSANSSLSKYY